MNKKVSVKNIISLTGFFCAYYFGAAFASGREMMQFFSGYGISGFLGLILVAVFYVDFGFIVMEASYHENFNDPYDFFYYSCGKKIGRIFVWTLAILLIGDMTMMTASAGANLSENVGFPDSVGRYVVFVSALTVCLGLDRIVEIVSKLGPFVAIFIGVVAVIAIVRCNITLSEGNEAIPNLDIYTGNSSIAVSSIKYTLYNVISILPVFVVGGNRATSIREVNVISVVQVAALITVCILVILSQIKNIESIYSLQIPNLMLIHLYLPGLQMVFSVILLICTYSSTTVMMWTVVRKFSREGTPGYYMLTIGISLGIYLLSGLFSFSEILNYITTIGMYVGGAFVILVTINTIKRKRKRL